MSGLQVPALTSLRERAGDTQLREKTAWTLGILKRGKGARSKVPDQN